MPVCWSCEGSVPDGAGFCPYCGHSQSDRNTSPLFVVDATTGLFNAIFMQAVVDQEANRAHRYRRPLSVVVVELDHPEFVNRDLGVQRMASLLREVAQVVVSAVRDTDTVGFWDVAARFAVVLPETDHEGAVITADKVRRAVAAYDFHSGGNWQRLTVSCGAAAVNHERTGMEDLLAGAVAALEAGRAHGPNRTHVVSEL